MRRRLRRRPAPRKALTPKSAIGKALGSSRLGGFALSFCFRLVPLGKAGVGHLDSAWKGGYRPRSYRGTRPRFASGTLMSRSDDTAPPPTLGYRRWRAVFSGSALRVSHGRSPQRSKERAERPGDGCPCVGAEEICGAPPLPCGEERGRTPSLTDAVPHRPLKLSRQGGVLALVRNLHGHAVEGHGIAGV